MIYEHNKKFSVSKQNYNFIDKQDEKYISDMEKYYLPKKEKKKNFLFLDE